ncbi:hypothetical protein [Bartonella sp. DGB1]|uniref:hypothetical protein n=1 Tax=Bartonella sp. DGB1 TaxID=3239807 RepID=UPI003524FDA6
MSVIKVKLILGGHCKDLFKDNPMQFELAPNTDIDVFINDLEQLLDDIFYDIAYFKNDAERIDWVNHKNNTMGNTNEAMSRSWCKLHASRLNFENDCLPIFVKESDYYQMLVDEAEQNAELEFSEMLNTRYL